MNFDEYIDRNEYPTMKWDRGFLLEHFGNADAIPMSVADLDIKAPLPVVEILQSRAVHGIFGYETKTQDYYSAFQSWYQERHGWGINREWIEPCPSVMSAVSILINQHSDNGDGVIIQPPVFFEFRAVISNNDRKIVKNPLKLIEGYYEIDFNDLENKAADPKNKILILCNPHNPVGRVWNSMEIAQIAEICSRHEIFVISDEIHGDFAFSPHVYIPYLTVSDSTSQNAAACISPGKTFSISGMADSLTIIPSETHRQQFHDFAHKFQINKSNVFSSIAAETAYRDGAEWLDGLHVYLQGNFDLLREFCRENAHKVTLIEPEGSFLAWLDFRALGLDAKLLEKFLAQKAHIALAPGYWFGREGAGFARMTVGCPRATLQRALDNLAVAMKALD
jgi:cystathionine beta-lyase